MEPQSVSTAIDMTAIIIAVLGGVFAVIRAVAVYYIDKRVHDQQLREVLENAVGNGLGTIQQAASGAVVKAAPHLNVPAHLAPGVQYVLDHASEAIDRFGITPEMIAEKMTSRIGLKEIQTNLAATTSSATAAVVPPLAASAPSADAATLNRQELDSIRRDQQGGTS